VLKTLVIFICLSGLSACDPDGKKRCDWVLEPEPSLSGKADIGYIPVCARNRQNMKQDCRLQCSLNFAKEAMGKKFRYVDLVINSPGIPRAVAEIKFCDGTISREPVPEAKK
jgi:hypothetical protein